MASPTSGRLSWQRNRVFRFFASLKLAVVLLAVLIIASIAGTIYESSFDAKVARAYVYGAPWFNLWLLLLVANLTVSALSRWPWKKHHVAFLITHLGIITLLFGSLIGRIWGMEGTITLFKGEPPSNRLLIDQHQLRVRDTDGIVKGYPAEFINRRPLRGAAMGSRTARLGRAAEHHRICAGRGRKIEPETARCRRRARAAFHHHHRDDGPAAGELAARGRSRNMAPSIWAWRTIELKRGAAPAASPDRLERARMKKCEIEESIFAFTNAPDQQVARIRKGGSTGAKVLLAQPTNGNKGASSITHRRQELDARCGRSSAARTRRWKEARLRCGSKIIGRIFGSIMASRYPFPSSRIILPWS